MPPCERSETSVAAPANTESNTRNLTQTRAYTYVLHTHAAMTCDYTRETRKHAHENRDPKEETIVNFVFGDY